MHLFPSEKDPQLLKLLLAADQGVRLQRKVRWPILKRSGRRELAGKSLDQELEQPLRLSEVLKPVIAEITDLGAVTKQFPRCPGDEHLAAVRRAHDPRGPVHIEPDVLRRHR